MHPAADASEIKIRQAEIGDAAIIVRLIRELAEVENEHSPITPSYTAYFLSQPNCHVLLAEKEDQIIGLLSYLMKPDLYHGSDTCLISELFVVKDFRGRGVGSALMEHLVHHLEASGCVEVSVSTMPHNQGAMNFYKGHGLVDEAVLLERHFK